MKGQRITRCRSMLRRSFSRHTRWAVDCRQAETAHGVCLLQKLEAAFGSDIVEVAEVIVDADVVEHTAEAADRDAHSIGATESAELTAAFYVWLEFDDDARDAALGELLLERRDHFGEVAKDLFVAAVAEMRRGEGLEHLFVYVASFSAGLGAGSNRCRWITVVFDVHPADAGFHRDVLGKDFIGRVALAHNVAGVEYRDAGGMIYAAVELGNQLAGLAHQIRFDFEAESQVAAMAGFRNLADLVGCL